ncbi:hypothetical protein [Burkholderia sp. Ac-20353]|uniref:hypothetical protein n=1 Tax=Burkholderia sp. Ac-20353 TaxID=2703894 RepID=UPI00197B2EA6|nr:hypothetical protein [Burkholderia sp. Ac-20353]MBN3790432.1 hypothetical protein [Burkholderia sp. Ac-20353]
MVRLIGCGLLVLTFASSGWAAEHYVEVWNPPEARTPNAHASAPRPPAAARPAEPHAAAPAKHAVVQPKAAAKLHKRHVVQTAQTLKTLKTGAHHTPAPDAAPAARPVAQPAPGRLTVMQPDAQDTPHGLAYNDIPRQYTPDGNVLRVGTRNGPARVAR